MTEADTYLRFVAARLQAAGWQSPAHPLREEWHLTGTSLALPVAQAVTAS